MNLDNEKELILEQSSSRTVVISAAGSGKALENGSLVYTENGPIKIEDCAVGQKIYGEDGKLHNILGVYPQGKKRKFIVQFTDKTEISCCEEHLWTFQTSSLRSKKSKKWITASLKDMIAEYPIFIKSSPSKKMNSTRRRNLFIPMTQPVEFPHKNIPLDPYTLGALLGDGHLNGAGKSSTFSNKDDDILERVIKGLEKIQCSLKKTSEDRFDYTIAQQGRTNIKGTFTKILEELKLDFTRSSTKFIPDIYKYNSTNIRLEVLRGLIDTDGYCDGSSYDIVLKSLRLILDIKEIVESLGLTATFQEKKAVCTNSANGKKDCGTVYRLRIKTSKSFPKLHFSKRREKQWKPTRVYSHRAINNIIETNDFVEMTCIKIDSPTELFLTSNFIVTHNTKLLTEKVRQVLKSEVDPSRIAVITFTNLASEELRKRLKDDYKEGLFIGTVHSLANQLLQKAGIQTKKYIDEDKFDELFRVVMENPFCLKKYEWVFLDEAQDSSGTQFEFLFEMLNPDNFFLVGDPRQCQPEGTMIQLASGETRAIEDLMVGDQLITYDVNSGRVLGGKSHNATNCKVLGIDTHIEDEPLVKVTFEDGNSTMYSYNHKTLMCLDDIKENFLVYLMCDKNNRFRVGKSQFKNTTNTNIYRAKMRAEGCQKIWILKTFKTDREARVYEDKISYFYRIPQITFQLNKTTYTQEDVDYIYDGLDTYQNALSCLHDHHKYYDYPFCSSNDNNHFASNAYGECYACNLIAANMSMLQFDPNRTINQKERKKRIAISHIEHITGTHKVYGLNVEKTHTYVADNIITHNCIYQWAGGNPQLIEGISKQWDVDRFEMTYNYRCREEILEFAKRILIPAKMEDNSIAVKGFGGLVHHLPYKLSSIYTLIDQKKDYGDWFVLARTNRQVDSIYGYLYERGVPVDTFKQRELNQALLAEKMATNTVKVLTAHSSKGLSSKKVIAVGMQYYSKEERRLGYVAATRAKDELYWMAINKNRFR